MKGYYKIVERDGSVHEYTHRASGLDDGFLLFVNDEEIAYLGSGGFVAAEALRSVDYFGNVHNHRLVMLKDGAPIVVLCHPHKLTLKAPTCGLGRVVKEERINPVLAAAIGRMISGKATSHDRTTIDVARRVGRLMAMHKLAGQEGMTG